MLAFGQGRKYIRPRRPLTRMKTQLRVFTDRSGVEVLANGAFLSNLEKRLVSHFVPRVKKAS